MLFRPHEEGGRRTRTAVDRSAMHGRLTAERKHFLLEKIGLPGGEILEPDRPDAALGGHDKVCKLLLQEGARVDLCMFRKATFSWRTCFFLSIRWRWTALHMAAWKGHPEVIRILVEGGSSVVEASQDEDMFMDAFQETPLHVATWSGH